MVHYVFSINECFKFEFTFKFKFKHWMFPQRMESSTLLLELTLTRPNLLTKDIRIQFQFLYFVEDFYTLCKNNSI